MINFVKSGDNLTLAAPYDVLSGGGFKVSNVFGVAANDTLSGNNVECEVEGVYDLAKDASVFAQGDLAYWDDSAKKVTSTVGSNLLIGAVEVAAATGAAVVRVNLFGVPGFSGRLTASRWRMRSMTIPWTAAPPALRPTATPFPTTRWCSAAWSIPPRRSPHPDRPQSRSEPQRVSAGNSILTATGKASLGLDAVVAPTCQATPFKMTAAGKINVTIATGPLTAGQIEVWALYSVASND